MVIILIQTSAIFIFCSLCARITEVAAIAQLVERIHGKDEVPGSNPGRGSIFLGTNLRSTMALLCYRFRIRIKGEIDTA